MTVRALFAVDAAMCQSYTSLLATVLVLTNLLDGMMLINHHRLLLIIP